MLNKQLAARVRALVMEAEIECRSSRALQVEFEGEEERTSGVA